jgi:hypothetical protein
MQLTSRHSPVEAIKLKKLKGWAGVDGLCKSKHYLFTRLRECTAHDINARAWYLTAIFSMEARSMKKA